MTDICDAVRRWRLVNGLSKRQLAVKAGLASASLLQIEKQCVIPLKPSREGKLRIIARTLGITFEELCEGPPVGTPFKFVEHKLVRKHPVHLKGMRRLRGERQLSLADLDRPTGYSRSYLGQVERGETTASALILQTLADYFKVTVNELY